MYLCTRFELNRSKSVKEEREGAEIRPDRRTNIIEYISELTICLLARLKIMDFILLMESWIIIVAYKGYAIFCVDGLNQPIRVCGFFHQILKAKYDRIVEISTFPLVCTPSIKLSYG